MNKAKQEQNLEQQVKALIDAASTDMEWKILQKLQKDSFEQQAKIYSTVTVLQEKVSDLEATQQFIKESNLKLEDEELVIKEELDQMAKLVNREAIKSEQLKEFVQNEIKAIQYRYDQKSQDLQDQISS